MLLTILHCFALHKSQILVNKFFCAILFQISHCSHLFHTEVSVHHVFLLIFTFEIYLIFFCLEYLKI